MNGQVIVIAPLITALVEAAKKSGLPKRFCPWFAMAVGLGFSFLSPSVSLFGTVAAGLMAGLGAVGLYEVSSPVAEIVKNKIK